MTGAPQPALAALAAVSRDRAAREGLERQAGLVRGRLAQAAARVEQARAGLVREQRDVERLESLSMTRILAGLRGSRQVDLDREQAEAQAARYAVAEAEARAAVEQRELESLQARIAALGDLDARHREALETREAEVAADPGAAATRVRLGDLATSAGTLRAEVDELIEATAAAGHAGVALEHAARLLGDAGGWATYDTFLGGGAISDLMKYERLDRAGALMREADHALGRLAAELADVGIGAVGNVGITEMARAFDIWFDNVFSDWAVRSRIEQAAARVAQLRHGVAEVGRELDRRLGAAQASLSALEEERQRLLLEGA